jgi:hypothetical protein
MNDAEALSQFYNARRLGEGKYTAVCPVCDSTSQTLYLTDGRKCTLIYCHSGCTKEQVLAAVGLKVSDLFANDMPYKRPPYDPKDDLANMVIIRAGIINDRLDGRECSDSDKVWIKGVVNRLKSNDCWGLVHDL